MFSNVSNAQILRQTLAAERPMTSLIDREIVAYSPDMVLERENWITAMVDYGRAISFDGGRTQAYRSIATADGTLFWMVRRAGKTLGYHSEQTDPLAAVEEAQAAWQGRRDVREDWDFVQSLARDLLAGRTRFEVRIEDAYASPLCAMGIRAFLRRHRLSHVRRFSGRFAAMLMKLDPQVGFVLYAAYLRHAGLQDLADLRGARQNHVHRAAA